MHSSWDYPAKGRRLRDRSRNACRGHRRAAEAGKAGGPGDCAPRVLSDFRGAVDSIRQTAWAVQQWSELQQQHRDPYSVLGILQEERVRRAAQIARDLTLDLESQDLGLETEGLANLFHAFEGLYGRLAPLFRKKPV